MTLSKKNLIMLNKEFFWKISGGDYNIIAVCEKSIQTKFARIGSVVMFISFLCFVSAYYTLSLLFNSFLYSIPIAVFFAWMVANIYLVLLTTLQKNLLPHIASPNSAIFSLIVRVMFLVLIAILISKPIEVIILKGVIHGDLISKKEADYLKFSNITKKYYDEEIRIYNNRINEINSLRTLQNNVDSQIADYKKTIADLDEKKTVTIDKMRLLIDESPYFIEEIKIISNNKKYTYAWIITIINVFLFLFPAFLKYYISATSSYYERKAKIEKDFILANYEAFKKNYTEILFNITNKNLHFEEKYTDSPFNTVMKEDVRQFNKEEDFINLIYGA